MSQTQALPANPTDPTSQSIPSTELDVTYRRIAYRLVPFLVAGAFVVRRGLRAWAEGRPARPAPVDTPPGTA